jgi:hypothetical protein
MSASIRRSVSASSSARLGCEPFEIGVLHQDGRMLLRRGWCTEQIDAAVGWLRRENAHGAHLFVRPHGTHALSLVDDLGVDAIAGMTDAGYQPALVRNLASELSGPAETQTNSRSQREHFVREGIGHAIQRRSPKFGETSNLSPRRRGWQSRAKPGANAPGRCRD